jgi:hypothetical protein
MNGSYGTGQNRMINEIVFENLVDTPFMNGKWELVISLLTAMNHVSHSLLVVAVPTLSRRIHHSISPKPLNIIHFLENLVESHFLQKNLVKTGLLVLLYSYGQNLKFVYRDL